jgi:hypothetical protein
MLVPAMATELRAVPLSPASPKPDPRQPAALPAPARGISFEPGKPTSDGRGRYFTVITQNAPIGDYQLFAQVANRWEPLPPQGEDRPPA